MGARPKDLENMDFAEVEKLAAMNVKPETMFALWKIDEKYWDKIRTDYLFLKAYKAGRAQLEVETAKKLWATIQNGEAPGTVVALFAKNVLGFQDKPEADVPDQVITITAEAKGGGKVAAAFQKAAKK